MDHYPRVPMGPMFKARGTMTPWLWMIIYVAPILIGISTILVATTTGVDPNLVLTEGFSARFVMVVYGVLVMGLTVWPNSIPLHYVTGILAVPVFMGRAGGFVELLVADNPEVVVQVQGQPLPGLWVYGSLAEKLMIGFMIFMWHVGRMRVISRQRMYESS